MLELEEANGPGNWADALARNQPPGVREEQNGTERANKKQ